VKYVGIDLHKKVISLCVVGKDRKVLVRKTFRCDDTAGILTFFGSLGQFEAVVEATASYEWLVKLLEPLARRIVLAHPKRLRVIAESKNKSDKIDAEVLAVFLAIDMIPESHRPTPRQREHRRLVRYRDHLRRRLTSVRCKIRHIVSDYNLDRPNLFSAAGLEYLASVTVSASDRWVLEQLVAEWKQYGVALRAADRRLKEFAQTAPLVEREAREILHSVPTFGAVTVNVVVSELGDAKRFRSQKRATSFAGLAPGFRESAGKKRELHITKEGSRLLRWAMIEAAWRVVGKTRHWGLIYEKLRRRLTAKKAIVAIARRLLCVIVGLLQRGERYRLAT
jgi:transposase